MYVLINKIPYLRKCREFFTLEFGIVDFDLVLDALCIGIRACNSDRDHIREMAFGDALFQGHHDPLADGERTRLMQFLISLRSSIVRQVLGDSKDSGSLMMTYVSTNSQMSLTFDVREVY